LEHKTYRILFLLILVAGVADLVLNEGIYMLFWARKFIALVSWLAFWR
tara:strand:+ start:11551 stop:11694 length:144 start_codon:yes stop_codon:yes gene_type:complete